MRYVMVLVLSMLCVLPLAPAARASDFALTLSQGSTRLTLSHEDLRAMRQVSFETTTIWTDGVIEFTGVPLVDLIALLPEGADTLQAVALNDYAVDIPLSALGQDFPIVAYLLDGQEFTPRNKGPFWIVFPYDSAPRYRSDEIYAYSVWQLASLNLEP